MFCIGERICYPMHGIGEIEGIEQRRVLGVNAEYYVLRFDSSRVSAMVPVKTAENIGLRRPVTREEGERVMRYIISGVASTGASQSGNWNRRYRENGKARVFTITDAALRELLGSTAPYAPPDLPFYTSEGSVLDVPPLKAP